MIADRHTVIEALRDGRLACFPTETLWSLSCRADDPAAVGRLLALKQRPGQVALAVGFADWDDAATHIHSTALAEALAGRFLPGPLSVVVRRRGDHLAHVAPGKDTLSIRVPDHPAARTILRATGPLVMTSANVHGRPDLQAATEVDAAFSSLPVLDAPDVPGTASTVVDATGDAPRVLREGIIPTEEVARTWP